MKAKAILFAKLQIFKINLILFLAFSIVLSFAADRLPKKLYSYRAWLFRERAWEQGGRFYERHLYIKKWKCRLPEISDFIKSYFAKKHLKNNSPDYLEVFLRESCKAELSHWLIISSSVLFLFWSDFASALGIFLLAVILNLPYVIIQRYNRPRLVRLLRKDTAHGGHPLHELELAQVKAHA